MISGPLHAEEQPQKHKEARTPVPPDDQVGKVLGWPETVTTTSDVKFQSPFATLKIPSGRTLKFVRVTGANGANIEVVLQNMQGTIPRASTNLDAELRKRMDAAQANLNGSKTPAQVRQLTQDASDKPAPQVPVSSSSAPVSVAEAPTSTADPNVAATGKGIVRTPDVPDSLGMLVNFRMPLSKNLRQSAIQYGAQHDAWLPLGRGMAEPLVSDVRSGFVDQPAWRDRLILATIFSWLGRNEEQAMLELAGRPVETKGISMSRQTSMDRKTMVMAISTSKTFRAEVLKILLGPNTDLWPPADKSRTIGSRFSPDALEALLINREFCEALVQSVSTRDYLPGVFNVLVDLYTTYPQEFFDYQQLSIALAIVYDVAPPPDWPHGQIQKGALTLESKPWRGLFQYFTKKDKTKSLLADIRQLPADQLKFVVDAPIPISELEWASNNITTSRGLFDRLYETIHYDMQRLREGRFDWESGPYRLESIKKLGGICTDQSYYCAMSAKAKGLPSLLFTGIGVVAGHAWFGYLRAEGWYMNAGRGNEPTGQAMDPQTWQLISDTELTFISGRQNASIPFQYSRNMLLLTHLPVRELTDDNRRRICRLAIEAAPDIPASWYAVADLLESDSARVNELRTHYRAMSDQFSKQLDIWAEIQRKLARLERSNGSESRAKSIEEDLLRSRSDIALDTAREILHRLIDNRDTDGALRRYKSFIQDYSRLGGMAFYRIALPFTADLFRTTDTATALKALEGAADCIPSDPESPVRMQYAGAVTWLTKEAASNSAGSSKKVRMEINPRKEPEN
ncbi:MAG: hypothetical protein ACAI35_11700 [Candidatus Methylacidiphilales bacterium]